MMELDLLTAVSPIDGRYRSKAGTLAAYFSEYALMKYRVRVEIEYFITLSLYVNCLCRSWHHLMRLALSLFVIFTVISLKEMLHVSRKLKV